MMQLEPMKTDTIERKVSVGYRLDPRAVAILEEASERAGIDKTEVVELCLFRAAEVVAEHMEARAESARRFATDGAVPLARVRRVSSGEVGTPARTGAASLTDGMRAAASRSKLEAASPTLKVSRRKPASPSK